MSVQRVTAAFFLGVVCSVLATAKDTGDISSASSFLPGWPRYQSFPDSSPKIKRKVS